MLKRLTTLSLCALLTLGAIGGAVAGEGVSYGAKKNGLYHFNKGTAADNAQEKVMADDMQAAEEKDLEMIEPAAGAMDEDTVEKDAQDQLSKSLQLPRK